jgi:hypothetical protein
MDPLHGPGLRAALYPIECSYFLLQAVSFSGRGRFSVHGTKTQGCSLSSRVMADDKLTHPGSSPQNLGQSDLEFVIRGDTESDHAYDSLDPTYVAKAKILNDALREIGMGKYQVWSAYYGLRSLCAFN